MARIEAVERVAHGWFCGGIGCDVLIPVRNATSKAPGFYINIERVSHLRKDPTNTDVSGEIFFHNKECMLRSLKWGLSDYYSGTWKSHG